MATPKATAAVGAAIGGSIVPFAIFLAAAAPVHGAMPGARASSHHDVTGIAIRRVASDRKAGGIRRTGLPLPRFASLRAAKVNLRAGPGVRYPVEWVYQRRGLPVMITAEFDAWRKIRDWRGTVGWIHRSMLTGKRTVIAIGRQVVLRREPSKGAAAVGRAEAGVVARVLACKGDWCRIEAGGIRGWGRRKALWGTLAQEKIK
jgi:SH3-like domain-containing protein